ncbi:PadR family transcriptional regulator [Herbiconiux liangxiaofengii]|uniref:PadR family transcriptional regulator n=1 Tax=Herbiconiux liangxiaofengii TaxID=3342795 RepID=UPI0035BB3759
MSETVFWILTALASERRHGYAVLQDVAELSGGTVHLRVTTLYASLERLTREGKVAVVGEDVVDGRARRYYEITPEGSRGLEDEVDRLAMRAAAARSRMAAPKTKAPKPAGRPAPAMTALA